MAHEEMSQLDILRTQIESILLAVLGDKVYYESKNCAKKHPFLFLAFALVSLFSAVPVVIFLGFAAVTLVISVICFILIEGSIIVIGGIILIGVISFISIITLGIIFGIATAYWSVCKLREVFAKTICVRFTPEVSPRYLNSGADTTEKGD